MGERGLVQFLVLDKLFNTLGLGDSTTESTAESLHLHRLWSMAMARWGLGLGLGLHYSYKQGKELYYSYKQGKEPSQSPWMLSTNLPQIRPRSQSRLLLMPVEEQQEQEQEQEQQQEGLYVVMRFTLWVLSTSCSSTICTREEKTFSK